MQIGFLSFLFLLGTVSSHDIPSFSWEDSDAQSIPLLRIRYPNASDDFAILKPFNPIPLTRDEKEEDVDHCIYDGELSNEKDVYVTLTGCPNSDNFQIQFRSKNLKNYMFKVTNGLVQPVKPIFNERVFNRDGSISTYTDEGVHFTKPDPNADPSPRYLNPNGYQLNIRIVVNDAFVQRFGKDTVNTVRKVMTHAQNYWRLRQSLGTQVVFKWDNNLAKIPGYHAAKTDLSIVSQYSNDPRYDDNVYLTYRNDMDGTVGMGWVGSVCSGDITKRSCLCEYLRDELTSGHIVAHEIGHNMGMNHDFGANSQPRYDSRGNPCTNQGGVMDYNQQNYNRFSSCSVEDMNRYINSMGGQFCLGGL